MKNRAKVDKAWAGPAWLFIWYALFFTTYSNAQSVLRTGRWVKIGVTQSGVYKISQPQLANLNPAFADADPRLFRLYGNGGAMLPQPNASFRPVDLLENAIQVTGEADGRFDAGDALLFFGQSPHVVRYDSTTRRFGHQLNVYSDTTFYFLTLSDTPGLRMQDRPAGNVSATAAIKTFTDYQFYEPDLVKISSVRSGREWLGDYLTIDTTKIVSFDVAGLVQGAPIRITASAVAGALSPTQFRVQVNDQLAGSMAMTSISGYEYDYQGVSRADTFLTTLPTPISPLRVALTFRKNGQQSAQGYLNFLSLQTQRELRQYEKPVWVRRLPAGQCAVRQATTALRVWDITNPLVPSTQGYVLSAAQEAGWAASRLSDYYLFTEDQFSVPVSLASIDNQDIRSQSIPDLLIVTPSAWRAQAERLAKFRREHDQLSVLVVTTQQVYNEFGSGQPDPTAIRDMARFFYRQQPAKLRYLLLFGDATFNYRNIGGAVSATQLANMVPVYESRESLHPVLSYSSDDYYGFMDASEGEWPENQTGDYKLDIGVGRLPVKSVEEASTVVDKLIRYSSDQSLAGDWQTRLMLVADDGDYNIHQQDADQMAKSVEKTAPAYRPQRVFLDDYPQENTSTGQKVPQVNALINQAMNDGQLIINYSGHGGILGLADEQIVTLQDILSWKNRRLPLFVTATCQFGRYDDPSVSSGAELTLLSRTGGAVGLLTTTRPVYANTNLLLNQAFYDAVFKPVNGQMPRLGDVMQSTKNNSLSGPVNRNFALLGDPSLRLAYPQAQAVLTRVNGKNRTSQPDTLRALQSVDLSGEIRQQDTRLSGFSGTLRLTLYDKATTRTTLGLEAGSPKMTYQVYSNPIFTGQVPVKEGMFSVKFIMPKDINYTIGPGKVYLYAIQTDSLLVAAGSNESLLIGGSVFADSMDSQPPVVALSIVGGAADQTIVRVTGPDVTLRINLSDNKGINIARSGLGHELTAQFGEQPAVVLNENYVATGTDGRRGEVLYTFRDIVPGTYSIRVKAWDINNNSAEGALTIVVSARPGLAVQSLLATPNPVIGQTTFVAELNRTGEPVDWTSSIYDLDGRLLNQQTGQCTDCDTKLEVGSWDGRTQTGQLIANGLYILQFQARSAVDGTIAKGNCRILVTK